MYRIIYQSRARMPLHGICVSDLAAAAADANGRQGITGLLLFDGLRFLQALEGEERPVVELMTRIEADARHDMIEYFSCGVVGERAFGDWSLRYRRAPVGSCASDFLEDVKAGVARVEDPHLQAAFIGFATLSARSAAGRYGPRPSR